MIHYIMAKIICYIRNNLSCTQKNSFLKVENVFFEILLLKIEPLTLGIVYRLLNQTNLIKILHENFAKPDRTIKESYILIFANFTPLCH